MKTFLKFALVSLLALAGCQSAPDGTTETLTAADFQREIVGKRTKFQGPFTATAVFKPDGTVSYTHRGQSFSGTWYFKGAKLCGRAEGDGTDGVNCHSFYRTGNGTYRSGDGTKLRLL